MAEGGAGILDFWKKRTARERFIALPVFLAALSWLLVSFPYAVVEQHTAALQAGVERSRAEVLGAEKRLAETRALAAELKSRGTGTVPARQLVNPKGLFLFFDDVSGEARRVGVSIVSVYPSQEIDKEKYKEVSMNLDLKARYRELAEYFKSLESLPVVVDIRKIRVEACPDSASVCAAQIQAVTFVEK